MTPDLASPSGNLRRKKRRAAAGLHWLAVVYPLSVGPANYAAARGWLPEAWLDPAYFPVRKAADRPELMEGYVRYVMGWRKAAWRHQGHLVDDPNGMAK